MELSPKPCTDYDIKTAKTKIEDFAKIFEDQFIPLLKDAGKRLPPEDAQDVVQKTFIYLWQTLRDETYYEFDDISLWLKRKMHQEIINDWRSKQAKRRIPRELTTAIFTSDSEIEIVDSNSQNPEDIIIRNQTLEESFRQLTDHQKKVFYLASQGYVDREIARIMGISNSAARKTLHDARSKLKKSINLF